MSRTALLAMMGPLVLAGCMMPASRMPPMAPVAMAPMAPMAQPAPVQPTYLPQPATDAGAWPVASTPSPGLPPATEPAPAPTQGISGLQERKPDLCKAESYRSSIGQPGSTVSSLGITRNYRVAEYRGIEPQEYVPDRIVFRLDAAGNISNIDCG